MSIKPLDMQVSIGQIHQVAQRQHQEQGLSALQQEQQASHLQKEAVKVHETVVETKQNHEGNSVRDALAQDSQPDPRQRGSSREREPAKKKIDTTKPIEFLGDDKGGVVDIRQ